MKVITKADIALVCDMLRRCQDMNDFINEGTSQCLTAVSEIRAHEF
jgi:hypothetical protein